MTLRHLKLGLSALGLVLTAVAIGRGDGRLNWLAIGVLAAAVAVRFLTPRGGSGGPRPSSGAEGVE